MSTADRPRRHIFGCREPIAAIYAAKARFSIKPNRTFEAMKHESLLFHQMRHVSRCYAAAALLSADCSSTKSKQN